MKPTTEVITTPTSTTATNGDTLFAIPDEPTFSPQVEAHIRLIQDRLQRDHRRNIYSAIAHGRNLRAIRGSLMEEQWSQVVTGRLKLELRTAYNYVYASYIGDLAPLEILSKLKASTIYRLGSPAVPHEFKVQFLEFLKYHDAVDERALVRRLGEALECPALWTGALETIEQLSLPDEITRRIQPRPIRASKVIHALYEASNGHDVQTILEVMQHAVASARSGKRLSTAINHIVRRGS